MVRLTLPNRTFHRPLGCPSKRGFAGTAARRAEQFGETRPLGYLRALVRLHGTAAPKQAEQLLAILPTIVEFKTIKDYVDELEPGQLYAWQSYLEDVKRTNTLSGQPG